MENTEIAALARAFELNHAATKETITELQESIDRVEARINRPGYGGGTRQAGDLTAEYRAIANYVRSGDEAEIKALSVADDVGGGYFVHPALSDTMTKRIFDMSPMRALVRVVTIGDGGSFEEPVDLDDIGAEWVGEEEARPETTPPRVGLLNIPLHEVYSLQVVTQRLLDDSGFDVGNWVVEKISDKFARADGSAFVTGSGHKRPRGFLTYPTSTEPDFVRERATIQYLWSGGATSITADAIRNLYWALRSDHRKNATWVMSSAVANQIDRLKDGSGQYLWRGGMTSGAPDELLGKPVAFAQDMPAAEAGALPIAFGDWKRAYTAIERPGLKFLRDPYTSKPSVVFYAYRRVGGGLANADAVKLLKVGTA